jgi:hypothetical protein
MTTAPRTGDLGDLDDLTVYAQLLAARRALADDLRRDPATMAQGLDPEYRMRPHLRVIGEAMADVLAAVVDRLIILTPPQVGKSTLVGEWGPFWWLVNRPRDDIVIASYAADLAQTRSKGIRQHIADHGAEYDLVMRPGSEAIHDWRLASGAHLRAVGVGGGLSGFPANLIIVDDPHADRASAESPRVRNGVHAWWSSTASARLQPDMGAVIAIMTRWHEDDFAGRRLAEEGRLEEGGRWKVVHLPAFADPKFGKDPMGREPGAPLSHPKIPTRDGARLVAWWQEKKRTSMVRDWHSLFQGDPQPAAGALVSAELLRLIRDTRTEVEPQKIAVAVDPSGGGRDNAGIIGGFLGDDGRLWITDDRSGVMSSDEWSIEACWLAYETDAATIIVETNYGGDMAVLVLRTAWKNLQQERGSPDPVTGEIRRIPAGELAPMIKAVRARQGKVLRAEPIAQQMILDRVRLRGIFPDLEHEWTTWQPPNPMSPGRIEMSPGRIDASVYLAYGLLPIPTTGASFAVPSGHMPVTAPSPLGRGGPGAVGLGPLG